jgi:hypothetical protein
MVYGNDSIKAICINNIDARCTFDLSSFGYDKNDINDSANYIELDFFEQFYLSCFRCGSGESFNLYGVYNGHHSVNFINVISEIDIDSEKNINALGQIINVIEKTKYYDYVTNTEFN